ncbi:MAG: hypothetical protein AAGJ82_10900 [Bacteroidota bacterium]
MDRLLLLLPLFFSAQLLAASLPPQQSATLFDHLHEVNAQWANQPDVAAADWQLPLSFNTDQERIQWHLRLVEHTLRQRSVAHLSQPQRRARLHHLSVLRQYTQRGQFPQNNRHTQRQPYFVDAVGTHCAVGYLLAQAGERALVHTIKTQDNYAYLPQLAEDHATIAPWAAANGFSPEELAWIQPGYPPVSRGWNAVGNNGGTNGKIHAMTTTYQGEHLIIAGQFSELDGQAANNIIGWDGDAWFTLGNGLDGIVYDLALLRNSTLVAVGDFTIPGQPDQHNVAIWQNGEWIGLQTGDMQGSIRTIGTAGYFGPYYVGGDFQRVNGQEAAHVAYFEYDFQNQNYDWTYDDRLGTDGTVYDIVQNGEQVLIAGEFNQTAPLSQITEQQLNVINAAYWDKFEGWVQGLEPGLPVVNAAAIHNGYLYLGDAAQGYVDVLSAGLWQPLQGLAPDQESDTSPVHGFVDFDGELYVYGNVNGYPFGVGDFSQGLVGVTDNYVYGVALFNDAITAAVEYQGNLYTAGTFTQIDGTSVNNLAYSNMQITSTDDPLLETPIRLWSHGQTVYLEQGGTAAAQDLQFFNAQGQHLLTRPLPAGAQRTQFELPYNGIVFCRVGEETHKLILVR